MLLSYCLREECGSTPGFSARCAAAHKLPHLQAEGSSVCKQVYDVTDYVDLHPGGDAILRNAGGNSTEGFFGPQHPPTTWDIIQEYYVGDLKL